MGLENNSRASWQRDGGISGSFGCCWMPLPPCSALMWQCVPGLIVFSCTMFGEYKSEAGSFLSGEQIWGKGEMGNWEKWREWICVQNELYERRINKQYIYICMYLLHKCSLHSLQLDKLLTHSFMVTSESPNNLGLKFSNSSMQLQIVPKMWPQNCSKGAYCWH